MGKRNPADFGFLIGLYRQGMDGPAIERQYGVPTSTLYYKMQEAGISRRTNGEVTRRHSLNTAFFASADNELAAYWLGFIAADGHVSHKRGFVRVILAARDRAHLVQLSQDTTSGAPMRDRMSKGWPQVELTLSSRAMCDDLLKLGVAPPQARRVLPLGLDAVTRRHFIRGYFDGDGSVSLCNGHYYINVCAQSSALIEQIAQVFREEVGIGCRVSKHKTIELWYVSSGGTNQVRKLGAWLYADATRWLDRKKLVFDAIAPRRALSYGPLSEAEFIALFPAKTNPELSALTGIPVSTLAERASVLGLRKIPSLRSGPLPKAWLRRCYQ